MTWKWRIRRRPVLCGPERFRIPGCYFYSPPLHKPTFLEHFALLRPRSSDCRIWRLSNTEKLTLRFWFTVKLRHTVIGPLKATSAAGASVMLTDTYSMCLVIITLPCNLMEIRFFSQIFLSIGPFRHSSVLVCP